MARMGLVIVIGAIIGSMVLANYVYTQYQTNFIEINAGELVVVGPVEYTVTFEGTHEGSKEVKPENTFVKIGITAKNTGSEKTLLSGGQFYIVDQKNQNHKAVVPELFLLIKVLHFAPVMFPLRASWQVVHRVHQRTRQCFCSLSGGIIEKSRFKSALF